MTLIGKSYWNNSIQEFVGTESWLLLDYFLHKQLNILKILQNIIDQ